MTITAARLGSSPLTVDWSALTRVPPSPGSRAPSTGDITQAWSALKARFQSGEIGFYDAPIHEALSQVRECAALAEKILSRGDIKDVLLLGIGGSALGPITLLNALGGAKTDIRFHILENVDAIEWKRAVAGLRPESTLVCIVTKSGTTFETLAQALIALDWLGRHRWKTHVVAMTDPEKGDLRAFAREFQIPTLTIAPSIGGRFSVFSPVGLFPLALAGYSVTDFLKGATQVRDSTEKAQFERNPVFVLAQEFIRHAGRHTTHVCMPYSSPLRSFGDWFVQLWGESLGKDGKGFTPIAALGATDQHSILQLLKDGPDDKLTLFLTVDQVPDAVTIPRTLQGAETTRYPAFSMLQGHSLHELLNIEYRAISLVLAKANRPQLTLQLDRIDERGLGALLFFFCTLTAFTGTLWGVNPFDQPGVEEGKIYIRDSLGASHQARLERLAEDDENSPVNRLRREPSPDESNDW
jgi:glucose-6-phosphate isomerase